MDEKETPSLKKKERHDPEVDAKTPNALGDKRYELRRGSLTRSVTHVNKTTKLKTSGRKKEKPVSS